MDLSRATPIPPLTVVFMVVMGLGFILADESHFSSPSFAPALALADPNAWGAVILTGGLILGVGIATRDRVLRAGGYCVGAVWCLFFGFLFGVAVANDKRAAFTGAVVYTFVGVLLLILARTARRH